MQSENRFFDDLAKMINGVAGTVAGAGREAEAAMRERAKEFVGRMDFVSREEFEAVKEMAARARAEAETLKARLDKLEERQSPQLRQSPWLRQRRLRRKRRRQSPPAATRKPKG
jgi:BMFP domain-containing protein YqiC